MDVATLSIRVQAGDAVQQMREFDGATKRATSSVEDQIKALRHLGVAESNWSAAQRSFVQHEKARALSYANAGQSLRGFAQQQRSAATWNAQLNTQLQNQHKHMATLAMGHSQAAGMTAKTVQATAALAVGAGRATPALNSFRGALTAVVANMLGAAPGVGRLTGLLGNLALGSGLMVGVLAGAAALGFTWKLLTRGARKIKEAALEAAKAIDELGKTRTSKLAENMGALNAEVDRLESKQGFLSRLATILGGVPGQGALAGILGRGAVTAGEGQAAALKRIAKAEKEIADANRQSVLQQAAKLNGLQDEISKYNALFHARGQDAEELQLLVLRYDALAAKRSNALLLQGTELRLANQLIDAKLREASATLELELAYRKLIQSRINAAAAAGGFDAGKPGVTGPSIAGSGMPRSVSTVSGEAARVLAARQQQGGSFLGGLRDTLKGMLDPKMLLTGVLTGGVSTALGAIGGAVGNFVTGLFTAGKRAKEAARQMELAMGEFHRSLARSIANLKGDTKAIRGLDALEEMIAHLKNLSSSSGAEGLAKYAPNFKSVAEVVSYLEKYQAARTKSLGPDWLKTAFGMEIQRLIDYGKALGLSLGAAADAANKVTESFTNVPDGYKGALRRYQSTEAAPLPGPSGYPAGRSGSGGTVAYTFAPGSIVITALEAGQNVLERIELEIARKKARGGSTITLDYA